MKQKPLLVIEHCEPQLSEWLLLEYKHSANIWGKNTVFANILDKKTTKQLKKIGMTNRKNAKDLMKNKKCIILDPQSKKQLTAKDFVKIDAIIVGGILGYEKPQGRTKKLITNKCKFETRNIGKIQLTIDGAVYVANAIATGKQLKDIEISYEVEIVHNSVHSTILPFGYPIVDNKPILTPGLIEYIRKDDY